jgi:hypothetical protein
MTSGTATATATASTTATTTTAATLLGVKRTLHEVRQVVMLVSLAIC